MADTEPLPSLCQRSDGTHRRTPEALPSLALIGFGAVARDILAALAARDASDCVRCVLARSANAKALASEAAGAFTVTDELETLLAAGPEIVIEAAGHGAVAAFGPGLLAAGVRFLIASSGALADRALAAELQDRASLGSDLWIAPGAIAGIDGLLAARSAGLRRVRYTSLKPPGAWVGTPAEVFLERKLGGRQIFFRGSARQAALEYPQNANVAATVALAGLGFDLTEVVLGADPFLTSPRGVVEASGGFGSFRFRVDGLASSTNPKTSMLTGHSLVSAALDGTRVSVLELIGR